MAATRVGRYTMSDNFYRTFEDKFRGSRMLIKSRLRAYLSFVEPLKDIDTDTNALDLGCGRGEWLELLKEVGISGHGIDIDDGMLLACKELDLSVETGDAITYLQALPDECQTIVSAFHVAEHVTFEQLQSLVSQALRVLKPGGILIMETPNPENIVVGTRDFYLDPTHKRPIPPELLSFLPEFYGFARTKVIRLQEAKDLAGRENITLQDVLSGVSPDYAVVSQKRAVENLLSVLDYPFKLEYGLSLESLTGLYQSQMSMRFQKTELQAEQCQEILKSVPNNRSWPISAPLRWCVKQWSLFREHGFSLRLKALIKKIARPLLCGCITFIAARPALKVRLVKLADYLGLYQALSLIYLRLSSNNQAPESAASGRPLIYHSYKLRLLTPKALKIYADLRTIVNKDKGLS